MRADWLGDVLRDAGLEVVPVKGWQTRGGTLTSIQGVVAHHTATGANWKDEAVANLLVHGRPDLAGPLAQLGLDRMGRFWLIAAGRCNHNGFGLWGNQSLGIEGFNDGVKEPWPDVQVDAFQRGAAAILRHEGLAASQVKGHKETDPARKIDPARLSMNVFRQKVAALLATPPSGDDPRTPTLPPLVPWRYDDVNIVQHPVRVTLDQQGNGYADAGCRIESVVGEPRLNGTLAIYNVSPTLRHETYGVDGRTRIEVQGGPRKGAVDFVVSAAD